VSAALQATCVAVGGRGVLIEGAPGTGKSSLALALIDRGAVLVGDDGVLVETEAGRVVASPHPNIAGKLEVRGVGIIDLPVAAAVPIALVIHLDEDAPRYVEAAETRGIGGIAVPLIRLWPGSPVLHLRAERALERFGLD